MNDKSREDGSPFRTRADRVAEEDLFQRFVRSSPLPILVLRGGVIEDVNDATIALFEATGGSDLLDARLVDMVHASDSGIASAALADAPDSGGVIGVRLRLKTLAGRQIFCEMSASFLETTRGPTLQIVLHDITDRERLAALVERSEAQFRALIENSSDLIVVVDRSATIHYISPSVTRLLGYDPGELLGTSLASKVPVPGVSSVETLISERIPRPGDRATTLIRLRHADGSLRDFEVTASNRLGEAAADGIVLNGRDITERVRALMKLEKYSAELERSNRELQEFARIASHDLQEPLRKIQAFGDRLRSRIVESLDSTSADYLDRMLASSARMQSLINDLLAYARISVVGERRSTVDLRAVVDDVLIDLQARIEGSAGEVQVGKLHPVVADPVLLRQLLQNLIANGLKFHRPESPPTVRVWSEPLEGGGVELTVEDDGVGFDEKYIGRIFKPFERLHSRAEFEGTGMGLAICRRIAEEHGGSIAAHLRLGAGSKFVVTFPGQPMEVQI